MAQSICIHVLSSTKFGLFKERAEETNIKNVDVCGCEKWPFVLTTVSYQVMISRLLSYRQTAPNVGPNMKPINPIGNRKHLEYAIGFTVVKLN